MTGAKQIRKNKGRVLLADEMGLGKTIQVLYWLKKCPKKRPVVVVCPANVKWVWQAQAEQHINMRSLVLEGTRPAKTGILHDCPLIIINYDILAYWVDYLRKMNPAVVICDESHYIKNRSAKRTKAFRLLAKNRKHVICVSGTPLLSRPTELWTTLNLLWPEEFPTFMPFAFKYTKATLRHWGWTFGQGKNLEHLHRKLKRLGMIRRLKKDVLKELPAKTRLVVPLSIENPKEYTKAKRDFITWLETKDKNKAKRASRAVAMVRLGYLKRLAADLKMKATLTWVDDWLEENDGKLVLFGLHKNILQALHQRYSKISVLMYGKTPKNQRRKMVQAFQKNKKIRLFIGNIEAAGVGITLTAASTAAFVELDWRSGIHMQAEDRIHRVTQTEAVMIYYLVARNTIEERLCHVLQEKQKTVSAVLDDNVVAGKLDFDIFDKLEDLLGE